MAMPSLPIRLQREKARSAPAYRQIYDRIRQAILAGGIAPGTRLPSWNVLALQLGVSRGTVKAAYEWLSGEGYIVAHGAAGTLVSPDLQTSRPRRSAARRPSSGADCSGITAAAHTSFTAPPLFQMGLPALDAFPRKLWSRIAAHCARRLDERGMGYDAAAGYWPLRESIAAYLAVARGIVCSPEQVLVTCGYTGALELICRALLEPGDRVWVEDPVYFRALELLKWAGPGIVPVPVDAEGMQVSFATARAPNARFAVVTPSHQSPLGMPLSLARRLELLEWATRRKRWIVEDDYYGELSLTSRPMSALASLDESGRVIYAGTFSKTLLPSLRLGYLVVPPAQIEHFGRVAGALLPAPPTLTQRLVHEFMRLGHFGRHLQRMRRHYAQRKHSLVCALESELGSLLRIDDRGSGLHLVGYLRNRADEPLLERVARAPGFGIRMLSSSTVRARCPPGMLLSFTNVEPKQAMRAAVRLATAIRSVRMRG